MSFETDNNTKRISKAIRRQRFLKRIRFIMNATGKTLLAITVVALCWSGLVTAQNGGKWRIRFDNSKVIIEKGRMIPWLEFESVELDIPVLSTTELESMKTAQENYIQNIYSQREVLEVLGSIYHIAGASIDIQTHINDASRAVLLLETATTLNSTLPVENLNNARTALSRHFELKKNYLEAWRYAVTPQRKQSLSRHIERHWFHHFKEHILDGNYRAAKTILDEMDRVHYDHPQLSTFRGQLSNVSGDFL